ncbi:MAG: hypothetical protein M3Y40_07440 [Chloroflexota bacterium]|nr:hypothetical protein [Chloroflexota bacterium]
MPFLPFVVLLAWQALSRSASFALGWATSLYFGQVPGRQGRMLSVMSLVAAGWVILVIGFGVPILVGALLEATSVIEENFDVEFIHYAGLTAGVVLVPPAVAAIAVWGEFHEEKSVGTWLRLVPISYPSTAMLGASVLMMVAVTPILLVQRWRQKRKYVQISLVMRDKTDDDDMADALRDALQSIGIPDAKVVEAAGPKTWPLRTVGFAVKHLLGAVVRGDPMRLTAGDLEIYAYATTISVQGPKEDTYRVRAAIHRTLGFRDAFLTWNEEAQDIEAELLDAHQGGDGDVEALRDRLDEIQAEMDTASLNSEEWNVLYRRRLQIELAARTRARKSTA